jgi:hypothetical protein
MNPTEEAAQVFIRLFEALARQNGKTAAVKTSGAPASFWCALGTN